MRTIVSKNISVDQGDVVYYMEIFGLSTDTKPSTGVAMGSKFTEVDTGDVYMYNEDGTEWVKQFSLQLAETVETVEEET